MTAHPGDVVGPRRGLRRHHPVEPEAKEGLYGLMAEFTARRTCSTRFGPHTPRATLAWTRTRPTRSRASPSWSRRRSVPAGDGIGPS